MCKSSWYVSDLKRWKALKFYFTSWALATPAVAADLSFWKEHWFVWTLLFQCSLSLWIPVHHAMKTLNIASLRDTSFSLSVSSSLSLAFSFLGRGGIDFLHTCLWGHLAWSWSYTWTVHLDQSQYLDCSSDILVHGLSPMLCSLVPKAPAGMVTHDTSTKMCFTSFC